MLKRFQQYWTFVFQKTSFLSCLGKIKFSLKIVKLIFFYERSETSLDWIRLSYKWAFFSKYILMFMNIFPCIDALAIMKMFIPGLCCCNIKILF